MSSPPRSPFPSRWRAGPRAAHRRPAGRGLAAFGRGLDGPRPARRWQKPCSPIELRLAKMAAINSQENDGMAIAMAGQSVELTRTAIAAVAIREIHAMNFPINHDDPLVKCAAHVQRHEIGNTMHRDMQRAEKSRCR